MSYNQNPPPGGCISFADVAKSDTTLLSGLQWLYVGGAGDLVLKGPSDAAAATLKAVPVGTMIPFSSGYVMASTTATLIVAMR